MKRKYTTPYIKVHELAVEHCLQSASDFKKFNSTNDVAGNSLTDDDSDFGGHSAGDPEILWGI